MNKKEIEYLNKTNNSIIFEKQELDNDKNSKINELLKEIDQLNIDKSIFLQENDLKINLMNDNELKLKKEAEFTLQL